jgi:geranylgeranyl pyrophosphate synthase
MVQTPNIGSITTLVERELDGVINSKVDLLTEASGHIIRASGKRIRPQVVLLAYTAADDQDISCAIPWPRPWS